MARSSLVTYLDATRDLDVLPGSRAGALVDQTQLMPFRLLPGAADVGEVVARWAELRDLLAGWATQR
jgi:hypothetical protein